MSTLATGQNEKKRTNSGSRSSSRRTRGREVCQDELVVEKFVQTNSGSRSLSRRTRGREVCQDELGVLNFEILNFEFLNFEILKF